MKMPKMEIGIKGKNVETWTQSYKTDYANAKILALA
jgi:hypothetical protein